MGHSFVLGCMLRPHVHTCTTIGKYRYMVRKDGEQHGHVLCTGPSNIQEANTHRVSGGADENCSGEVGRSTKPLKLGAQPALS